MITQDEFLERVKKQQALLRKVFASKKRRFEEIQQAIDERYGYLVGKFVCFTDGTEEYYCISKFVIEESVKNGLNIVMECNVLDLIKENIDSDGIIGVEVGSCSKTYAIDDSIDLLLSDRFVGPEKALKVFNRIGAAIAHKYGFK